MRMAWVLILLAAVGAAAAGLRTRQIATQGGLYRLEAKRLNVRRRLWDQQLRLGRLRAPRQTELRGQGWALEMVVPPGRGAPDEVVRRDR